MSVRYWAYFAAKVILVGGILYGSLGLLESARAARSRSILHEAGAEFEQSAASADFENLPGNPISRAEEFWREGRRGKNRRNRGA